MLNERPRIETPEKLAETIDIILDLYGYDRNNFSKRVFLGIFDHKGSADELLHKCKTEARKNAVLLIDQEPLYPPLPSTQPDPLDDLREIQHWCIMASRAKSEKQAATQTPANNNKKSLSPAREKAYQSYNYAIDKKPELANKNDKDVYVWLKENGCPDYVLPAFESWSRYVGAGRYCYGTQKNTRRAGRNTSAIKAKNDPALLSEISNQYQKPD